MKEQRKNNVREIEKEIRDMPSLILQNIPNFLTISRVLLTFVVVYLIFTSAKLIYVVIIFAIAALTDFLDGNLARKFKWESEFGRRADMMADRFLWIGTALAFIITFGSRGILGWKEGAQLILIFIREIISAPFVIVALFFGNPVPNARYIAKITTVIQGFALPLVIISAFYNWVIYLSFPLSIACGITGFISAFHYLKDIHAPKSILHRRNL